MNALHLFGELARFPSLGTRSAHTGAHARRDRDPRPLMPPMWRIQEVGRLAPPLLKIVMIEGAAHAMNFSHPGELAHAIGCWLDGREITDDPDQPGITSVLPVRRDDR